MSPNGGWGGGGCGLSANEYSCAHGAQIKFRDLTPYLTYVHTIVGGLVLARSWLSEPWQMWFVLWWTDRTACLAVPYRMPWQELPSCELMEFSSYCYMVNLQNHQSRPQSWMAARGYYRRQETAVLVLLKTVICWDWSLDFPLFVFYLDSAQ